MSVFRLLKEKKFAPFFLTQFAGAANDNIFKFALTLLVTYNAKEFSSLDPALLVNLISGLFILPFLLFSATSGQISDKYDKTKVLQFVKCMEIGIMLLAAIGMYIKNMPILLFCIFLLGLHSTIFGPAKYAYLPHHLKDNEVIAGNGLVEMGTFIAILAGTIAGGILIHDTNILILTTISVSLIGFIFSLFIPSTPSNINLKIEKNPFKETINNIKIAREVKSVYLSMLGISWLWFFGAIFLTQFSGFTKNILNGDANVVTLLLAIFSIGIATGSLLCEKMSGGQVEIGLVPFGSIGMSIFCLDLCLASSGITNTQTLNVSTFISDFTNLRILFDLFMMAMFAGFYSVPLYALIQTRTKEEYRSRIIAANNILNALFMISSAIISIIVLSVLKLSIIHLFLITAILNAAVAIYIYKLVPEFLIRFIAWILIHSVYRLKKINTESIPKEGPALLIANHVSFVDAVVLMAISPRPIKFVMDSRIFKIPVLSYVFRNVKAIPIASAKDNPEMLNRAYDTVDTYLKDGELVCIFPEGRITDTGELYPFKKGVQAITTRYPVSIYPIALKGLWGSFFSRKGGNAFSIKNIGLATKIEIIVGESTTNSEPEYLQNEINNLLKGKI